MTDLRLAGLGALAGGVAIGGAVLSTPSQAPLLWYELHWPRAMSAEQVSGFLRSLAGDHRRFIIAFEAVSTNGRVSYRLGVPAAQAAHVASSLRSFVSGASTNLIDHSVTAVPTQAWTVRLTTRHRALRTNDIDTTPAPSSQPWPQLALPRPSSCSGYSVPDCILTRSPVKACRHRSNHSLM